MYTRDWNRIVEIAFGCGMKITSKIFFFSKKNQVTLLKLRRSGQILQVVAKYFVWGDLLREKESLLQCSQKGIAVPRIIAEGDRVLFLEYLPGRDLLHLIQQDFEQKIITDLATWLVDFHRAFALGGTTLLKGDLRLHNFVFSRGRIFGLDFEEARCGKPDLDVADLLASLLDSAKGSDEAKMDLCREFLNVYEKKAGTVFPSIEKLVAANLRRRARVRRDLAPVYRRYAALLEGCPIMRSSRF